MKEITQHIKLIKCLYFPQSKNGSDLIFSSSFPHATIYPFILSFLVSAPVENDIYSRLRLKMVKNQLQARDIRDKKVLEAMATVPRHLFVSHPYRSPAYDDHPLPID